MLAKPLAAYRFFLRNLILDTHSEDLSRLFEAIPGRFKYISLIEFVVDIMQKCVNEAYEDNGSY